MLRKTARIALILLCAGAISVAIYFLVPQSSGPARPGGAPRDSETTLIAELDVPAESESGSPLAKPGGERHGGHGEFSLLEGLAGIVKNGSLFAVAFLGAVGIRKMMARRRVKAA